MADISEDCGSKKFKILAINNTSVIEEDKYGQATPTIIFSAFDYDSADKTPTKVASYVQSGYLKIGQVIMATQCSILNDMYQIDSTSAVFPSKFEELEPGLKDYGKQLLRKPVNPIINLDDVQQLPNGTVTSVQGIISKVEEVKEIRKKLKTKRVRDILLKTGRTLVRVTLWDKCADYALKVGDIVEFHDIRVKDNTYQSNTTKGLVCSMLRNMKVSEGDPEVREYILLAFDINGGNTPMEYALFLDRMDLRITCTVSKHLISRAYNVTGNMIPLALEERQEQPVYMRVVKGQVTEIATEEYSKPITLLDCRTIAPTSPLKQLSLKPLLKTSPSKKPKLDVPKTYKAKPGTSKEDSSDDESVCFPDVATPQVHGEMSDPSDFEEIESDNEIAGTDNEDDLPPNKVDSLASLAEKELAKNKKKGKNTKNTTDNKPKVKQTMTAKKDQATEEPKRKTPKKAKNSVNILNPPIPDDSAVDFESPPKKTTKRASKKYKK